MSRIVVNALQSPAANRSLSESAGSSVQSGQPLIDAQIARRLGQRGKQRPQSFRRHVIGNEKLGVRQCPTNEKGYLVGVALINEGRSSFKFIYHDGAFFRRDQVRTGWSPESASYLLIVACVQLILWLQLSQLKIVVARLLRFSRLRV